jgi:hypothetical protein
MLTCHREADITKKRIEKVLKSGANVILTTKGIDDMALKVRVYPQVILRRFAHGLFVPNIHLLVFSFCFKIC